MPVEVRSRDKWDKSFGGKAPSKQEEEKTFGAEIAEILLLFVVLASDEGKMLPYWKLMPLLPAESMTCYDWCFGGVSGMKDALLVQDFQCLLLRPSLFSASKVAQGMPVGFGNWYEFVSSIVQLKIDCYGERITCSVLSPTLYFTWDKKGKPRLFAALVGYKDSKASPVAKGPESEGSESEASEGLSSRGFCSINAMNVKRPTRNRYSARK
ncbi:hypothetical protein C3L33_08071, partial [Rhododendron williamsianum]